MDVKASIEWEKPREGQGFTALAGAALALPVILTLLAVIYLRSQDERTSLIPIVLATGEYAPFTGEELGVKAQATAVVDETFREIGYQPRYEYMPWNQVSNSVKASESDVGIRAGFPYSKYGDRTNIFLFSEVPLVTVGYSLFMKKGGAPVTNLDNVRNLHFILQDGYEYPPAISRIIDHSREVMTRSGYAAFQRLLAGDGSYVLPEAGEVGWSLLQHYFPNDVDSVQSIVPTNVVLNSPLYLIASRGNPSNERLLQSFDDKLRQMRKSGTYDAILAGLKGRPDSKPVVVLKPLHPGEAITATGSQGRFTVPAGARAEVEMWGSLFRPPGSPSTNAVQNASAVAVRLLDGPMAGSTVQIDGARTLFEFTTDH